MTTDELKERAKVLEQALILLIGDFHQTACQVLRVRIIDEGPEVYDQEIKVRVGQPQRGLKNPTEQLEKAIKRLLGEFEEETGFRVAEVLGPYTVDGLRVLLDPLPYPQRHVLTHTSKDTSLSVLKVN